MLRFSFLVYNLRGFMVTKLVIVLILGLLGIILNACTMTLSIDSLEAGSKTTSTWSKNSSSSSIQSAGIDLATSQGQSLPLQNRAAEEIWRNYEK